MNQQNEWGTRPGLGTSVLLVIWIMVSVSTAWAQVEDCAEYGDAARWLGSSEIMDAHFYSCGLDYPYLYIATGWSGVVVADISDPGNINTQVVEGIEGRSLWNRGDEVFLTTPIDSPYMADYWLISHDFSDRYQPVVLDSLDIQSPIADLAFHEDHVLIATPILGLLIVDNSDPLQMEVVNTWHPGGLFWPQEISSVKVVGDVGYLGTSRGLHVLDLSFLPEIELIGYLPGNHENILVDGGDMVTCSHNRAEYFDISDPRRPILVRTLDEMGPAGELDLMGGIFANSKQIIPLYPIGSEQSVHTIGLGYGIYDLVLHDDWLIQTNGGRIDVFQLEKGRFVEAVDNSPNSNEFHDSQTCGEHVFFAAGPRGLRVMDRTSFTMEEFDNPDDDSVHWDGLDIHDDLLIGGGHGGLWFYDISQPENPVVLSNLQENIPGFSHAVIQGQFAWAKVWGEIYSDLYRIDLTDPVHPTYERAAALDYEIYDIDVDGDILFTVGTNNCLNIMSVAGEKPSLLSQIEFDPAPGYVQVWEGIALVNNWDWVKLVDVTDPAYPVVLSTIPLAQANQATVQNGVLYITTNSGMHLFDITDPTRPEGLGSFWNYNRGHSVLSDGTFLLYGWTDDDLILGPAPCGDQDPVLESPVKRDGMLSVDPNPFNPMTNIQFELPRSGDCELVIYNLHGQVVQHLFQGECSQGPQQFRWQGKDDRGRQVPSAVYFARLKYPGGTVVQKMTLVR